MGSFTIHNLDKEIERRIRQEARRSKTSLNQTIKRLLAKSTGVRPQAKAERRKEFLEVFGVWSQEDLKEFEKATEDDRRIDERDWQ